MVMKIQLVILKISIYLIMLIKALHKNLETFIYRQN
jgi:hypothetical protein